MRVLALAGACLVLSATSAYAYTAPPGKRYPPPLPPPIRTVDHPATDQVAAFDFGNRGAVKVALTFDADMTPGMAWQLQKGLVGSWYNREVVDILRQEHEPATIFLTGLWARAYPDDSRSLAADPLFEIGSHTYDHAAFRLPCYGLGGTANRAGEIADAQAAISAVTGVTPRLIRFPGDCWTYDDVALAQGYGLTVIAGDVRSGDGFNPSPAAVVSTVLRQVKPGSIVLMHLHGGPNAPSTAPALRELIPAIRAAGLGFATVSELIGRERAPGPALASQPPAGPPGSGARPEATATRPPEAFAEQPTEERPVTGRQSSGSQF